MGCHITSHDKSGGLILIEDVHNMERFVEVLGCKVGTLQPLIKASPWVLLTSPVGFREGRKKGSKKFLLYERDNIFRNVEDRY